jgi:hypothetical protein
MSAWKAIKDEFQDKEICNIQTIGASAYISLWTNKKKNYARRELIYATH